ncbi:ABC transporter ATP-binding protein, partial [Slackia exigua]
MSVPVIEFEGVSFTYAGADEASVKKVSLAVEAGECVVLCGRSGCGKTTLTRLANGLAGGFWEGRRTGAVRVEGRNVDEFEEWQLAEHIGSVFQNPRTQFFNLDTTGEIAFALENLGVPRDEMHARVARVADELGATDLLDRSIFKLSGGQMQSIAFASVSVCEPRAYVLDEPSSNLDPVGMERLAALIAKAKAAGSAVLVAEHRLAYLSDAADTYVLIEEGRVAHAWTPSEFKALSALERTRMGLRSPAPPRTADLVARLRIGATSAFPALEARGVVAEYDRDDEVLRNVTAG